MKKVEIAPLPEAENKNKLTAKLSTGDAPVATVKLSKVKKNKSNKTGVYVLFLLLISICTIALIVLIGRQLIERGLIHIEPKNNVSDLPNQEDEAKQVEFTDLDNGFTFQYPENFNVRDSAEARVQEIISTEEDCLVFLQSRDKKLDIVISVNEGNENGCIPIEIMEQTGEQTLDSGFVLFDKALETGPTKYHVVTGINSKFGVEITIFYSPAAINKSEVSKIATSIIESFTLPSAWRATTSNLCSVELRIPPDISPYSVNLADGITKLWRYDESSVNFLGLFDYLSLSAFKEENATLTSGNSEGSIQVYCNENNSELTTDELFTTFKNELESQDLSIGNSEKGTYWGHDIYFLTINGSQNPNDLFYLFATDSRIYLIFKASTGSMFVRKTTNIIFDNLEFQD